MQISRSLATLLLAIPALAADAPLPDLKVEPTGGGSLLTVKNTYSQPLAAFVIELVNYPGGTFSFVRDELGNSAIAAGDEKKITVANMTVGAVPDYVKMLAAIYLDGTTTGAPDKLKELIDRRKSKLTTTRELIQRIEKAKAGGKQKEELLAELREWSNSFAPIVKGVRAAPNPSQAAARVIVLTAASQINTKGADEELAALKTTELELAGSKPGL
jgi:hypothetical protein